MDLGTDYLYAGVLLALLRSILQGVRRVLGERCSCMLSCLLAGCVVNERTRQSHLLPGMLREHLQQITTAAKGESGHHNSTWSRLSLAARSCHMLGGGDTFWAVRGHSITRRYQRRIGAAIASYISSRYLQFCRHRGFGRRRDRRRRNHQRRQRRRCHRQPPPPLSQLFRRPCGGATMAIVSQSSEGGLFSWRELRRCDVPTARPAGDTTPRLHCRLARRQILERAGSAPPPTPPLPPRLALG